MKKKYQVLCWFCLTAVLLSRCSSDNHDHGMMENFPKFYKEGHRGTRGLMPENTIPSMKKAIEDGANIIEVDIQISRDKKVMVSHDAHINRQISLLPDGREIPEADASKYILHQMPYDSIRKFDVGLKYHSDFPQQKKLKAYIPLLGELIDSVEQFTTEKGFTPVIYNIEIKARPEQDGFYQPVPAELIGLVMEVVKSKEIGSRYYIQSFDIRQIQEVHNHYPRVTTGFLTSKKDATLEENLKNIGFIPQIYSPQYQLATKELIEKCHAQGMKFVPWTVNTLEEMKGLKEMGVDGIITDYPNLFSELER
jgi:glycerophosphoryl diester phosphodiesterase